MDFQIIISLYSKPTTDKPDYIFRMHYYFETEVVKASRGMIWPTIWQEIVFQR